MDKLILAFGPIFAAGFALQQLLEILVDPLVSLFVKGDENADKKKLALGIISLLLGLAVAYGAGLRVLQPLGVTDADFFDAPVTALVISAGTEGVNSIIKFLGYAKTDKKAQAATHMKNADAANALSHLP